jgi:hypothetical protein
MPDLDTIAAGLREQTVGRPHQQAAVELLIWHESWLRRATFRQACLVQRGGVWTIDWTRARAFADHVSDGGLGAPRASTSEAAILDLAVALGEDRFRLTNFGHAHRRSAAMAFWAACGLGELEVPGA